MKKLGDILLISCYELGHQPAALAMPLGFLRRAGYESEALDLAVEEFRADKIEAARFIGISVPMHTALRLGALLAKQIRKINPRCHICFYGLYASLNADYLLETTADSIIGGEFEESLLVLIEKLDAGERIDIEGVTTSARAALPVLKRLSFPVPYRATLPLLESYAKLEYQNDYSVAGYVEASRGCLHHCAHCPIPPVYNGRFFVAPKDVVLKDIRQLAASGARHITFGDPDFLNGPGHSIRIVRAMREEFPDMTFDFTCKIEHILKHRSLFPEFGKLGSLFVVSAVESLSDVVLAHLDKGHTRADVIEAFKIARSAGIALRPSFVAFTPWTAIDDYIDMLEFVESERIIDHVDAVQYSIRLLVPPGSILLSNTDMKQHLGPLVPNLFTYEWSHPDPRMDELHKSVCAAVEEADRRNEDPAAAFRKICDLAYAARGDCASPRTPMEPLKRRAPRLTESWFC